MIDTIKAFRGGTGSPALNGLAIGLLLALLAAFVGVSVAHRTAELGSVTRAALEARQRVVPPDVVPQVEPIRFQALAPDKARIFNASVPFSTDRNPAARPFRFSGPVEDRLRALDCLAAAVLYEAGDDAGGQRAVAQVVLNRVRHPAFPKTVCGVVFQGSERRTGCQFTFTCDGALNRLYSDLAWDRARQIADAALSGAVFKPVGHATHYHTDWVVPYWSSSLDKIVAIKTHLFFRWTGWWGTPPAFRFSATGSEPRIPQLGARFAEHALIDPSAVLAGDPSLPAATLPTMLSVAMKPSSDNPNVFLSLLSPQNGPNFAEIAAFTCGNRSYCKFMAWTDPAKMPANNSSKLAPAQLAALSFSYVRDRSRNLERALWDCTRFKQSDGQCLWSKAPPPLDKPTPASPTPEPTVKPLDGVRFKDEAAPAKPGA